MLFLLWGRVHKVNRRNRKETRAQFLCSPPDTLQSCIRLPEASLILTRIINPHLGVTGDILPPFPGRAPRCHLTILGWTICKQKAEHFSNDYLLILHLPGVLQSKVILNLILMQKKQLAKHVTWFSSQITLQRSRQKLIMLKRTKEKKNMNPLQKEMRVEVSDSF